MVEFNEGDRDRLIDSLAGMHNFGRDEEKADDEAIWITKREAFLITEFVAWLIRSRPNDEDLPEEQQNPVDH